MKLVKLPNGNWINPEFVSEILTTHLYSSQEGKSIEVTQVIAAEIDKMIVYQTEGDKRDELSNLFNKTNGELTHLTRKCLDNKDDYSFCIKEIITDTKCSVLEARNRLEQWEKNKLEGNI